MIDKKKIVDLAKEGLESNMFLVEVNVSKSNAINVYIDSKEGVNIDQCIAISRKIESSLDRDTEDFELVVSSAGLGQPYKVIEQYYKNVGSEIEIITQDGVKTKGTLESVIENGVKLKSTKKVKVEGSKKKKLVEEEIQLDFKNIKSAKTIISF
ncbi:MAG: ribosome assembly cofactor RimP [Mariniphaga sp.]|nr:ribosome assembly cofactor RimP [Mariniphaga sp.]